MHRTMTGPSCQQTRLLDVGEAAAYLTTSQRHIRRLRAESRLAYVKVGAKLRFRRYDQSPHRGKYEPCKPPKVRRSGDFRRTVTPRVHNGGADRNRAGHRAPRRTDGAAQSSLTVALRLRQHP